jgi:hypothetical protein
MSDEYKSLEDQIKRMLSRKEKALGVIADLKQIIAEVDTDIASLKLQLAARRYDGDTAEPNEKGLE